MKECIITKNASFECLVSDFPIISNQQFYEIEHKTASGVKHVACFKVKLVFPGRNWNIVSDDGHLAEETSLPLGGVLLKQCSDSHSEFLHAYTSKR